MAALTLDDVIPLHVADIPFPELPAGHPLAHLTGKVGAVMAFAIVQPGGIILFETGVGRPHLRRSRRRSLRGSTSVTGWWRGQLSVSSKNTASG